MIRLRPRKKNYWSKVQYTNTQYMCPASIHRPKPHLPAPSEQSSISLRALGKKETLSTKVECQYGTGLLEDFHLYQLNSFNLEKVPR